MSPLVDADERPHQPGPSSAWSETWEWRLVVADGSLAVAVVLIRRPAEHRMTYICSVFGDGRDTVSVVEHDIELPRRDSLELRASGIWADHICEQAFSHWTLGLEAFGLALDDPDDAVGHGRGVRTPMGLDVEWEDDVLPVAWEGSHGYLAGGRAHGEVLVGTEHHDVDGAGMRMHRWGTGPRLLPWGGRGDRLKLGSEQWPGSEVARATADDGAGEVVDWLLSVAADDRTPASLTSRPRLDGPTRA